MGDATPVRDRVAGGERDRGCTTSFLPFLVPRYRRKQDTRNGRGPAVPVVQRLTPSPCGAHMTRMAVTIRWTDGEMQAVMAALHEGALPARRPHPAPTLP